jgi:hypothetical protein
VRGRGLVFITLLWSVDAVARREFRKDSPTLVLYLVVIQQKDGKQNGLLLGKNTGERNFIQVTLGA